MSYVLTGQFKRPFYETAAKNNSELKISNIKVQEKTRAFP